VAIDTLQALDPRRSTVDDANEFRSEIRLAVFEQALLGFLSRKPCGISIRFLRRFQPRHFTKVRCDRKGGLGGSRRSCRVRLATKIVGKCDGFHPAMNARFFKRLKGCGLSAREARFDSAFGENPTPAASLNQQKLNAAFAEAVTNGGDLRAYFQKR
jgi:hypothetical protein